MMTGIFPLLLHFRTKILIEKKINKLIDNGNNYPTVTIMYIERVWDTSLFYICLPPGMFVRSWFLFITTS